MENFSKANISATRRVIQDKLNEAAKELGINEISLGRIRFDLNTLNASIKAEIHNASNNPKFIAFLESNGLSTDLMGKTIKTHGKEFIIKTIDFKKIKYLFICEDTMGGEYKLSIDQVKKSTIK